MFKNQRNDLVDTAVKEGASMLLHLDIASQLSDIKTDINNKLKVYW